MSFHNVIPKKQRAIVLSGGGALGAYQVGVLKILARKLREEDEKNGNEKELLFDIIAGTSIGAMNGAVLMSEFLRTRNWKDAVTKLEKFWVEKEIGLASSPSQENLREEGWTSWYDESKSNPDAAPEETARRYYSVKHFFWKGAPRVQKYDKTRPDSKLFDNKGNQWFVHSSEPLKNTILRFAEFPIATSFVDKNNQKQPRFLIFSVDVTEGATVTFDSFTKPDDPRTAVYAENSEEKRHDTVFSFDHGISIEHVMASGMLPEFYDYQIIHGHKYWDGGLLSNTPFRELLQAHQKYWTQIVKSQSQEESGDIAIPDLEVYIVNLHPSRQSQSPADHDGVKDTKRQEFYLR